MLELFFVFRVFVSSLTIEPTGLGSKGLGAEGLGLLDVTLEIKT